MWARILALGIIGVADMGAVSALAKDPAPAPIVEYPVAERAKKTDRLSLVPEQRTVGNTTSAPAVPSPPIASVPPSPATQTKNIPEPRPVVVAPHRHEATDRGLKKRKRLASSKQSQAVPPEKPTRTVDCSGNRLDSLLRSMRLKPGCL
jgi:hypothetical protein